MCRFKGRGEWVAAMQNWADSFDNRYIILDINYKKLFVFVQKLSYLFLFVSGLRGVEKSLHHQYLAMKDVV